MNSASLDFKEEIQTRVVHLTLAALEHEEMNGQVKVRRKTLCTIAQYLMVHARVSEAYTHFALMCTTDKIFPVLPIKCMLNKYGDPTTPFTLETGTKTSVSHLRVLSFPCVVQKATTHVGTKALNMRH